MAILAAIPHYIAIMQSSLTANTWLPFTVSCGASQAGASRLCYCLQTASESTLEDAEGVYVSLDDGPHVPLGEPVNMARFTALRRVWLRHANNYTMEMIKPGLPPSLRRVENCNIRGVTRRGRAVNQQPIL